MGRTAVVHLVRRANGTRALESFLDSYRRHAAGLEHELVLLCKGFDSEAQFAEYEPVVDSIPHSRMFVPDTGFDIGSYRLALEATDFDEYCFLNSFSILLAPDWLAKLSRCLHRPGVGLVGATGSYESTLENLRAEIRSIRGFFRRRKLLALLRLGGMWRTYPSFPNPNLRTNAILGRRELLCELFPRDIRTKEDALAFESGRNGLTRQIQVRGLQTLVVGRDGVGYAPEDWPASRTFRLQDQANLLVADNQTEAYARAAAEQQRWLTQIAWGDAARAADQPA